MSGRGSSTARHYRGHDPLTDELVELWVVGDTISREPVSDATTVVTDGWIVPGLVDAHNHVGIAPGLGVTIEQARACLLYTSPSPRD